jgi:serine/threonine protein kinase
MEFAEGISMLHLSKRILHADIKLDNIILKKSPDGWHFVLIDFGISEKFGKPTYTLESYYTWWFRFPRLFMDSNLNIFKLFKKIVLSPVELSPEMDWWAFFITMMNTFLNKRADFRGWKSSEDEVRKSFEQSSVVMRLIDELGFFLHNKDMDFVSQIYFALLNDEGAIKFAEIFKRFEINVQSEPLYERYKFFFQKWRNEHPIIHQIGMVWNPKRFSCEDPTIDVEGVIKRLNNLFVEILRDGADLSILGLLSIDHVDGYFTKLNEILETISKIDPIYF